MISPKLVAREEAEYPARIIERKSKFESLSETLSSELQNYVIRSEDAIVGILDAAKQRAEFYENTLTKVKQDLSREREKVERVTGG
jgi:hypothetical protein